jgi:hypothetical protein
MRTVGDDYEFYDTPAIDLTIVNITGKSATLYTDGVIDDSPNHPADNNIISLPNSTPNTSCKIFTTTPALMATVTVGATEFPVDVTYIYDPQDNKMLVTIH